MLDEGVSVYQKDNEGRTALHELMQREDETSITNYLRILELLLQKDIDLNARTYKHHITAIHLAAQRGLSLMVQLLLQEGGDVNVTTTTGLTAVQVAFETQDVDLRLPGC